MAGKVEGAAISGAQAAQAGAVGIAPGADIDYDSGRALWARRPRTQANNMETL